VADEYHQKGGNAVGSVLPGGTPVTDGNDPDCIPYGGGRADIRLALGGDGESYVLSKSDGMIRKLVMAGSVAPPAPPGAPTNLNLKKGSHRSVDLAWSDNAANENGFYVQTSVDGVNWTTYATLACSAGSGATVSYTTGSFSSGLRYFRVQAFNRAGASNSNVVSVRL